MIVSSRVHANICVHAPLSQGLPLNTISCSGRLDRRDQGPDSSLSLTYQFPCCNMGMLITEQWSPKIHPARLVMEPHLLFQEAPVFHVATHPLADEPWLVLLMDLQGPTAFHRQEGVSRPVQIQSLRNKLTAKGLGPGSSLIRGSRQ